MPNRVLQRTLGFPYRRRALPAAEDQTFRIPAERELSPRRCFNLVTTLVRSSAAASSTELVRPPLASISRIICSCFARRRASASVWISAGDSRSAGCCVSEARLVSGGGFPSLLHRGFLRAGNDRALRAELALRCRADGGRGFLSAIGSDGSIGQSRGGGRLTFLALLDPACPLDKPVGMAPAIASTSARVICWTPCSEALCRSVRFASVSRYRDDASRNCCFVSPSSRLSIGVVTGPLIGVLFQA